MTERRFETCLLTLLGFYALGSLLLACDSLPTAPIPSGAEPVSTAYGLVTAAGCYAPELVEIVSRVERFFAPYPAGYGDTEVEERYSPEGLTIVCASAPGTCSYARGNRVITCRGSLGGVTHDMGHDACYQGAATTRIDCFTCQHAGGQDLLGNRCTVATAGPCV